jgi:hypothetical protein
MGRNDRPQAPFEFTYNTEICEDINKRKVENVNFFKAKEQRDITLSGFNDVLVRAPYFAVANRENNMRETRDEKEIAYTRVNMIDQNKGTASAGPPLKLSYLHDGGINIKSRMRLSTFRGLRNLVDRIDEDFGFGGSCSDLRCYDGYTGGMNTRTYTDWTLVDAVGNTILLEAGHHGCSSEQDARDRVMFAYRIKIESGEEKFYRYGYVRGCVSPGDRFVPDWPSVRAGEQMKVLQVKPFGDPKEISNKIIIVVDRDVSNIFDIKGFDCVRGDVYDGNSLRLNTWNRVALDNSITEHYEEFFDGDYMQPGGTRTVFKPIEYSFNNYYTAETKRIIQRYDRPDIPYGSSELNYMTAGYTEASLNRCMYNRRDFSNSVGSLTYGGVGIDKGKNHWFCAKRYFIQEFFDGSYGKEE